MITLDFCLREATTVAIAGHVRPDGDCVGSCLAVYNYIKDNYPDVEVQVYLDPVPEKFHFLTGAADIRQAKGAEKIAYDLFIALDCGDAKRLGHAAKLFFAAKNTLCVDHHVTNESFAKVNEIHPQASSTCELVYRMLPEAAITTAIAECLYLGIVHDTGVFQYSCTSPLTMQIAGALMGKGIAYSRIVDETYYIRSYPQQRMWGKAFLDSRLCLDGRCIYTVMTRAERESFGVKLGDMDGIVSQLRSTVGVEVAIFLYETMDGWKISLRSANDVDVAEIAKHFGGGGHARAAGASTNRPPEETLQTLLALIQERL